MSHTPLESFLLIWAVLILLLAISYRSQFWMGANPILRPRLEVLEPFQATPMPTNKDVPDGPVETFDTLSPADASLDSMRKSYTLLSDPLMTGSLTAQDMPGNKSLTAASCYDADFQKRTEKVGNYRQLTNNYKRGVPDSCSAPLHDLVLKQYKTNPVPFAGCLDGE
jgi:hypothetical protein